MGWQDGLKQTDSGAAPSASGASTAGAPKWQQGLTGGGGAPPPAAPQSGQAAADKMAVGYVGDLGPEDALVRGMTFGWEPEIESDIVGGVVGAGNLAREAVGAKVPYTAGEARKAVRDRLDTQFKAFSTEHPFASGAAEFVGGIAGPGGAKAAQYIGKSKDLLGVAKRSGQVGAVVGGITGASDNKDRLGSTIEGVKTGAEFGFATPFVGVAAAHGLSAVTPFFSRVASGTAAGIGEVWGHIAAAFMHGPKAAPDAPVTPEEQAKATAAALDYVGRLARTVKATPATLRATDPLLKAKGITGGEALGRGGVTELTAAGRTSGASADLIEPHLRARIQGTADRVQNDLAQASGVEPSAINGKLDDLHEALKAKAAPLYDVAFTMPDGSPRLLDTPEIRKLMTLPAVKDSFPRVLRALKNLEEDPSVLGFDIEPVVPPDRSMDYRLPAKIGEVEATPTHNFEGIRVRIPTIKLLHQIKSGATASLYEKATDAFGRFKPNWFESTDAKVLQRLRNALTEVPEYRLANDAGGDLMQMQEARELTPQLLSNAVDAHQFRQRWEKLTQAQKQTVAGATVAHYRGLLESGRFRPQDFQPSANEALRVKMTTILGVEGAKRFSEQMAAEVKLKSWANRIMPGFGSHTAEVVTGASRADIDVAKSLGYAGVSAGKGNHIGMLAHIGNALVSASQHARLGYISDLTKQEVTKMLLLPPDQLAARVEEAFKAAATKASDPNEKNRIQKIMEAVKADPSRAYRMLSSLTEQAAMPDPDPSDVSDQLGLTGQ